jgi:hypothetical protein
MLIEVLSSHGEVLPGMAKYLIDLGYNVDVIFNISKPRRKIGSINTLSIFCRFVHENLKIYTFKNAEIKTILNTEISRKYKNIIINTYKERIFEYCSKKRIFELGPICMVHNPVSVLNDPYSFSNKIITLIKMDFYNRNPPKYINAHYFGEIKTHDKLDVTTFITVGNVNASRNFKLLFDACDLLIKRNIVNFKVNIIGNGNIKVPTVYDGLINFLGYLDFKEMFIEVERSDFILALLDGINIRYLNAASGSYQLSYGFLKPIVLLKKFSEISNFTNENSILYEQNMDLAFGMEKAINMRNEEYQQMIKELKLLETEIYNDSLKNLQSILLSPLQNADGSNL